MQNSINCPALCASIASGHGRTFSCRSLALSCSKYNAMFVLFVRNATYLQANLSC
jgi:hypothetical protein